MPTAQAKVAILGGDPVMGEALEVLLQGAGYLARFLSEPDVAQLSALLADSQLLLIAPVVSAERRRVLLDVITRPDMGRIPILELLPANGGERSVQGRPILPWPCPTEELKQAIDATLLTKE
jgi:hypothetical protein